MHEPKPTAKTTDLPARLRAWNEAHWRGQETVIEEAAAEIERLRAALEPKAETPLPGALRRAAHRLRLVRELTFVDRATPQTAMQETAAVADWLDDMAGAEERAAGLGNPPQRHDPLCAPGLGLGA
jgi:hypothetical protein